MLSDCSHWQYLYMCCVSFQQQHSGQELRPLAAQQSNQVSIRKAPTLSSLSRSLNPMRPSWPWRPVPQVYMSPPRVNMIEWSVPAWWKLVSAQECTVLKQEDLRCRYSAQKLCYTAQNMCNKASCKGDQQQTLASVTYADPADLM